MNLKIPNTLEKRAVFEQIASALKQVKSTVIKQDKTRTWEGFFVINESQASAFTIKFFPHFAWMY